jgi:hypothetical protein
MAELDLELAQFPFIQLPFHLLEDGASSAITFSPGFPFPGHQNRQANFPD